MILHTIVIPTLNEGVEIRDCLMQLQGLRTRGFEVVVVDGGSVDRTTQLVEGLCDQFISARRGRAVQMNVGARRARGEMVFFLHVDTRLPENLSEIITSIETDTFYWGRFDVRLSGRRWLFRVIEAMVNIRSRLTGIATGDQVIFMTRKIYLAVDGFPEIALMEDVAMSRRLKNISPPLCLRQKVTTSSRRWEKNGTMVIIIKMWCLRFAYFIGVNPEKIAARYD
jgi:rSAM/selenodomain-associated transferase 2